MKKWFIIILIFVIGFLGYKYVYQDHRNIANESSVYKVTAIDISIEFEINPISSENKYLNKTIEISGKISDKNSQNITLDGKVFCQFSSKTQTITDTNIITVKGRFIGYDDLLEQVKLDQCIIIN